MYTHILKLCFGVRVGGNFEVSGFIDRNSSFFLWKLSRNREIFFVMLYLVNGSSLYIYTRIISVVMNNLLHRLQTRCFQTFVLNITFRYIVKTV